MATILSILGSSYHYLHWLQGPNYVSTRAPSLQPPSLHHALLVPINFSQRNYHCRVISAATRARLLHSSSHSPRALNRAGHTFTHRSIGSLGCLVRRLDQARWIEHLSSTSNVPNDETNMAKF
ncbi:hypothetical protein F2Q70_00045097 [Brassica cretica]|uniref:Uncharacterized protein n=1 Tax=Brassica cretica TaxID=69181 RepID=A0A8S9KIV9_BRACR|nr:hypothetical protein F2Q70_00045097 [Brassica cretica]